MGASLKGPGEQATHNLAALAVRGDSAQAYYNLGLALHREKKLADAIAAYHKAIELDPKDAKAYYNLAVALHRQKKVLESIVAYQRTVDLNPKHARAYSAMGQAMLEHGSFADAAKASQRALELLPAGHPLRDPVQEQLQQTNHLLMLERRLALVLNGKESASAVELLQLASMCQIYHARHTSAVRLYQEAFRAQPDLENDLSKQHRYNAACSAALAGTFVFPPSGGAAKELLKEGTLGELQKLTDEDKAKLRCQEASKIHDFKMTAGKTYVLTLDSKDFDTFLKLETADGKKLAENDDISLDNLNSRLVFTAVTAGV